MKRIHLSTCVDKNVKKGVFCSRLFPSACRAWSTQIRLAAPISRLRAVTQGAWPIWIPEDPEAWAGGVPPCELRRDPSALTPHLGSSSILLIYSLLSMEIALKPCLFACDLNELASHLHAVYSVVGKSSELKEDSQREVGRDLQAAAG